MKRMLFALLGIAVGALSLTLGVFEIASAHATLDHCTPVVSSTVASVPAQIVCVYSEEIDTKQSTMSVWNVSNAEVDKKDAHVDLNDPDHKTLVVSLDPTKAQNGLYTVKWHAVTPDDNGISDGSWQFVIGSASTTPYPPTIVVQGETTAASTPEATMAVTSAPGSATPTVGSAAAAPTQTSVLQATAAATVQATPAAPTTAPATGTPVNGTWALLGLIGALLLLGGTVLKARFLK